jgi:hypothetical protein
MATLDSGNGNGFKISQETFGASVMQINISDVNLMNFSTEAFLGMNPNGTILIENSQISGTLISNRPLRSFSITNLEFKNINFVDTNNHFMKVCLLKRGVKHWINSSRCDTTPGRGGFERWLNQLFAIMFYFI